ncbi:related to aminoglycoside acetyltransferase regulator from P. stuartii [Cephalotrichum gorgonifer]|uniref:Related to aminoglycoside acetyltransferase regulator from P. stuartii n=1 Tax=Cephalotrichum gorgonifer TaxID=2041049 RepID=A0AAE8N659_9PEZI|nr:related to aminoglycoside acetyltransferase regulator from P. stuartii [Cephalotrichum gorgonifer]
MGPAAFLCRLCARTTPRTRLTATTLGANFRPIRSRGYRTYEWRWFERPRRPKYAGVILLSTGNAAALGTLAFVELPHRDPDGDADATWESRLLEVSRNELETARADRAKDERNLLVRITSEILSFVDTQLWEPLCTALRFLHLVAIFVPVIVAVPAIWIGRRVPERDNERSGTLWWYGFLVQSMEWAGPAFIKLGQWAASRTDIFPTQMCEVMSKLHSNAPAHSMRETRRIIEAAFGGLKFDDIFSEFDETPLGVGAIAQVYKAKLRPDLRHPGDIDIETAPRDLRKSVALTVHHVLKSSPQRVPSQSVAVKVLHPRVEHIVRRDLRIMMFFAEALNLIPSIEWLSLPDEVAQFGFMMRLQLDLRIEAANLARFRQNFKDRTTAWFPYPYPELTTRNVLVEEFANGMPLSAFLELGGGIFRTDVADEGLDAFLRMLLLDNFIHADLHPGNIMVRFYQPAQTEIPRLMKPVTAARADEEEEDVTEVMIRRLQPYRQNKDTAGWQVELEKIEKEGYRPQLIFIDTGLVTELNATNRQNFLDLFRAVAEFDGYKAGHLMCERCRQPEAVVDKEVFALKMQHLVLDVKGRTLALGNVKLGDILQRVLAMVRKHHVRLEGDFVNVVISILLLEGIGRNLNPEADLLRSSLPILRQLSAQSGAEMAKSGDFSMILVWVGLETRRFLQASVEDVERCVKYDLLSPNV